jgi:hypothetical protein
VVLARETADRVGLGPDSHDVPATVTLFHSDVVALTGAGGATAAIGSVAAEALLMLLAVGAAAILAVAGGGHLWRRSRGREAGWTRRAAVSMTVGVFAGMAAGAASGAVDAAWIMPATFAVVAVVSLAVAVVPLPRALRTGPQIATEGCTRR